MSEPQPESRLGRSGGSGVGTATGTVERLVFLPGLGADWRLFAPQLSSFPGSGVPEWIPPRRGESIGSYAERFAERQIDTSVPYGLVGFSFGGMVALEIAARLPEDRRPAGVMLLSGIRSKRAVSLGFKLQQAFGGLVPHAISKPVVAGPLADLMARVERLNARDARTLAEMASEIHMGFLMWAAKACACWRFDGRVPVPVAHLHGRRDRVIPYVAHPKLPGGDAVMVDAGHLITWTAPADVNGAIRGFFGVG